MKSLFGVLLAATCFLSPFIFAQPGKNAAAIINGEPVEAPRPYFVALVFPWEEDPFFAQFCAGSLIAPDWVLTAAHCLYGYEDDPYEIYTGTASLRKDDPDGVRYAVDALVIHPDFVPPDATEGVSFDNDIALLHLAEPVPGAQPVNLPPLEFELDAVRPGTLLTIQGWGATGYDEEEDRPYNYPDDLRETRLPLLAYSRCAKDLGRDWITPNMLCAGYQDDSTDTCQGDSGGPAVMTDKHGKFVQVGIVSWGIGCALPEFHGAYTNVSRYINWITAQTCEGSEIPGAPVLTRLVLDSDNRLDLRFANDGIYDRHRLYYAPAGTNHPIRHLDLGHNKMFQAKLPAGLHLNVILQSRRGHCISTFSQVLEIDTRS